MTFKHIGFSLLGLKQNPFLLPDTTSLQNLVMVVLGPTAQEMQIGFLKSRVSSWAEIWILAGVLSDPQSLMDLLVPVVPRLCRERQNWRILSTCDFNPISPKDHFRVQSKTQGIHRRPALEKMRFHELFWIPCQHL